MLTTNYDHVFVDHLDEPVQLREGLTYRVLETQVTAMIDDDTANYLFAHRVVAL